MGLFAKTENKDEPKRRSIFSQAGKDSIDTGLPQFGPEDYYAQSDEFQNILWRAKQFGTNRLTPGEQKQLKAAQDNYPQVNEWLSKLESKQEEKEADGPGVLDEYWEGLKPNLEQLPAHLTNLWNGFKRADDRFTAWAKSETEWPEFDYAIGQPELIEELIQNPEKADALGRALFESTAKGLAKFVPHMGESFWSDTKKYGAVTAAVRLAAGLYKFPFQVGTDMFNMFGAGIEPSTQVGDVPIEEIQAPTSQEVVEQYKQDPTPIVFVALPIIKGFRARMKARAEYQAVKESIETSEAVLEADYQRLMKLAEEQLADTKKSQKISEKPTVPETPDVQTQRIKETPAGQLMTEAMQVQDKYSAKDMAELYALDREYVENIVSGDRTGKKPPEPKDIADLTKQKFGPREKTEGPAPEKPPKSTTAKPKPETVKPEKPTEPAIETQTVKDQKAKIAEIEADISERQRWIDELGESQDSNAKEFKFAAQAQLAEKEARLADAMAELERIKKEPPPEPAPPSAEPEVTPAKPVKKEGIVGATEIEKNKGVIPQEKEVVSESRGLEDKTPSEMAPESVEGQKVPPATRTEEQRDKLEGAEPKTGKIELETVSIDDLKVDEKRFQNRKEYNQDVIDDIRDNFDMEKLKQNPIVYWRDPATGDKIVISGHHRYFGTKGRKEKFGDVDQVPVVEFKGTEAEAIYEGRVRGNRATRQETLAEDVRAYNLAKEQEKTNAEIEKVFGDRTRKVRDLSTLDPNGKFLEVMSQLAKDQFPYVDAKARVVGRLRKRYGDKLTNRHEDQIFNEMYVTGDLWKITEEQLNAIVEKQVSDASWDPSGPLILRRGTIPTTGARARPDMQAAMRQIDKANEMLKQVVKPDEREYWQQKKQKAMDAIREIDDSQTTMELGFMGSPEAMKQLYENAYKGVKGVSDFAKEIYDRNQVDPITKAGVRSALDAMTQHHREIRDVDILADMMTKQFKESIPKESRQGTLTHAIEQGKGSKYWGELSTFEQGIAEWIRNESNRLQDYIKKHDLMDLPDRPGDQAYLYHWIKDPKTGKPLASNYGKFSKTGPQFRQRKYATIEDLEGAGFEMTTHNAGTLLGEAWKSVMRVHQTREMVKNLNSIEAAPDVRVSTKVGDQPAGMVETWKTIKDNQLEEMYQKLNDPGDILSRPINLKSGRIIQGQVGVLKELHPFVQSYIENPTYGKIANLVFASKAVRLAGLFHPFVLGKNEIIMGRNPLFDLYRGGRIIRENDATFRLLRRNGLNISGFEDIGFNPKSALKIEGKSIGAKLGNVVTAPLQGLQSIVFDHVHPRLKAAYSYNVFNKEWPNMQKRGLTPDQGAREVVRMADQIFSGEDYKYALLESSRFAAKYYYSAAWRKAWQMTFLSPTWQVEHIRMFAQTGKSVIPEVALAKLEKITPKDFQLQRDFHGSAIGNKYRQYLAGGLAMYTFYNMLNWVTTKQLDGGGRFMFQNEGGKEFRVRAPWNNDDGSAAYFMPMKSSFEVPEAYHAMYKGDFGKFAGKLTPMIGAAARHVFNVGDFGRKMYDETDNANLGTHIKDWTIEVFTPLTVKNLLETNDKWADFTGEPRSQKPTLAALFSALAFPVSKGHPGGEWGKKLSDFRIEASKDRKDNLRKVDNAIQDGNILGAAMLLNEMGATEATMKSRMLKHRSRLLYYWKNMGQAQQYMFIQSLTDEERESFFKDLQSGK